MGGGGGIQLLTQSEGQASPGFPSCYSILNNFDHPGTRQCTSPQQCSKCVQSASSWWYSRNVGVCRRNCHLNPSLPPSSSPAQRRLPVPRFLHCSVAQPASVLSPSLWRSSTTSTTIRDSAQAFANTSTSWRGPLWILWGGRVAWDAFFASHPAPS